MKHKYVPVILAGLALLCLVAMGINYALAQPACGPHDEVVSTLAGKYKEYQAARATSKDMLVELFVSDSTWTIILTNGSGVSCLIAAGENWEAVEVKPGQQL